MRKILVGALLAGATMIGGVAAAAPAQAATDPAPSSDDSARAAAAQPYFRIFYGQNCYSGGTGSRAYFGTNAGEAWINDRYNEGGAGNGQYIRKNAASVYVANGRFLLSRDGGYSYRTFTSLSGGTCFNLDSATFRNQNTNWIMKP